MGRGWWFLPLAVLYFALLIHVECWLSSASRRTEGLEALRDSLRVEVSLMAASLHADLSLASVVPCLEPTGLRPSRPGQLAVVPARHDEASPPAWAALLPPLLLRMATEEARATEYGRDRVEPVEAGPTGDASEEQSWGSPN